MKPLSKTSSLSNKNLQLDGAPRPTLTPFIEESKTSEHGRSFYTPVLSSKHESLGAALSHNQYLRTKYADSRNSPSFNERMYNFDHRLTDKAHTTFYNGHKKRIDKENEGYANLQATVSNADLKKLAKIQALFVRDSFEKSDFKAVVQQWFAFQNLLDTLVEKKPYDFLLKNFISSYNFRAVEEFTRSFTSSSEARGKIAAHFKIELWAIFLFCIYASESPKNSSFHIGYVEELFKLIIKNAYYMSLIVVKAVKNNCLSINVTLFDEFSKKAQKHQFETGIPLIRTLKLNNEASQGILSKR